MILRCIPYVIDDDVCAKLHPEADRQLRRKHHRVRVIGVDMQDRRVDRPRDVGSVERRSRIPGVRYRGSDLVVQNQVQRSADAITACLREIERFGHYPLGRERGIPVHQHRHHPLAGAVRLAILQRARHAADDRRDAFQVRWIVREQNADVAPRGCYPHRQAGVILDIRRRETWLRDGREQRHQLPRRNIKRVQHHVQAPAMRHSQHHVFDAELRRAFDDSPKQHHEALTSLEAEMFGSGEICPVKVLEGFSGSEPGKNARRVPIIQVRQADPCLHLRVKPLPLLRGPDMRALKGDRAAVAVLHIAQQLGQAKFVRSAFEVHPVAGGLVRCETVGRRIELGDKKVSLAAGERIDRRPPVTVQAIAADERLGRRGEVLNHRLRRRRSGAGANAGFRLHD
jgi:hypothetical protein